MCSELLSKSEISFQEYVSEGISVFYGYLVYKLRRLKDATMLPFAGHWYPVWSKKQDCRIKLL